MEDTGKGHAGNSELREIARILLGEETLDGIIDWFMYIVGKKARFVVFVVRRCYLLALIVSKITGWEIADNDQTVFLTDAAFYLQSRKMVEYFREHGAFPSILLVDDILIHGRNLNELILRMENEVCRQLRGYSDGEEEFSEARIRAAFQEAVRIEVYTCAQGALLLWEDYKRKLTYRKIMRPKEWHQLSSDISTLILSADLTNACYTFTEHLSEKQFNQIHRALATDGYERTVYQSTVQYAKVQYLEIERNIKVVYTLRIIKNMLYGGYRVAPFIFLPVMTKTETEALWKEIFRKVSIANDCRNWIESLDGFDVKRSRNELLTMILSHSLLQEFNDKYCIKTHMDTWASEFNKLSRNYNSTRQELVAAYLNEILQNKLFTKAELDELFVRCLSKETYLIDNEWINSSLSEHEVEDIFKLEEEHFYQKGYEAEQKACIAARQLYLAKPARLVSGKQFRTGDEFKELFSVISRGGIGKGFSCFLQLMDAGVLSVSSNVSELENREEYCQYVRYGEQALLIRPLKFYEYIPMLAMMQRKCVQWGWEMEDELDRFVNSEYSDIPLTGSADEVHMESIIDFLEELAEIDQQPEDWNGNYLFRKAPTEIWEQDGFIWLNDFREKLAGHVSRYSKFLKARKY